MNVMESKNSKAKVWKAAFIKTLPVLSGYMVLGTGFGILLRKAGFGVPWALASSAFIYAGAMQFVMITLLTSGASLMSTALTTLMVNARHLFYGIAMTEKYKDAGPGKPYMIFGLTDETYSLLCTGEAPDGLDFHEFALRVTFLDQCYWVTGSLIGNILGTALPFDTTGIEFSMTALFITVFVDQWLSTKHHGPALIGLGISIACLIIFGSQNFLIPAMIGILGVLTLLRAQLSAAEEDALADAAAGTGSQNGGDSE